MLDEALGGLGERQRRRFLRLGAAPPHEARVVLDRVYRALINTVARELLLYCVSDGDLGHGGFAAGWIEAVARAEGRAARIFLLECWAAASSYCAREWLRLTMPGSCAIRRRANWRAEHG